MRKALLLSTGVGAALVLAVFVGAAAATTGAPVFYDARYPAPASTDPGGYDVSEGDAGEPGAPGAAEEADAGGAPLPSPPGSAPAPTPPPPVEPTPPATTPPTSEPETPTPTPIPTPTPTPTPTPDPESTPDPAPDPEYTPIPDAGDPVVEEPTVERVAPGGPTPGAPAPETPPSAEDQEAWLAFQQIVRECMAGAGQEYLYWEWWNPGPDDSNRFPAMPADLTAEEVAAWEAALHGDPAGGDAYRWEDAGCWGYAVHVTGGTN